MIPARLIPIIMMRRYHHALIREESSEEALGLRYRFVRSDVSRPGTVPGRPMVTVER